VRINPIGYVLERFDSLGRFRSEEQIWGELDGELLATLPIDSTAVPAITPGDATSVSSGPELSELLAGSGQAEACFARQYFRFTFARRETEADACTVDRVETALRGGGTIRDALLAVAMDPTFRTRRIQ
jgi:hypothetical protein